MADLPNSFRISKAHLRLFKQQPRLIRLDPFPWGIWLDITKVGQKELVALSKEYEVVLIPKNKLRG